MHATMHHAACQIARRPLSGVRRQLPGFGTWKGMEASSGLMLQVYASLMSALRNNTLLHLPRRVMVMD